ncbi:MAG: hypothetical protein KDE15_12770, partial [Erythrobacter sp.]|nr:hypothetical protein [Erythrobacter sp.]
METNPFGRAQLVQRALTLMIAGQIALAAIVIGFVSNTWAEVAPENQRLALVVVCGSGAHFMMSLLLGGALAWLFRARPDARSAACAMAASATYIYSSLIVQHSGLAHMLTGHRWDSFFPLGNFMIGMMQGDRLEESY